jgi:quercetin dioxygenase-like cupin family protein
MSTPAEPRSINRVITTHDKPGLSVFASTVSETPPLSKRADGMQIWFCYGTNRFPVRLDQEEDISIYKSLVRNPSGIILEGGSVARLVDFPPGYRSSMHRTISLNYNFVIEGEVELILDSGETRILKPGDMVVQRGINHAWRNISQDRWARISAFALPAEKFAIGERMSEETGTSGIMTTR